MPVTASAPKLVGSNAFPISRTISGTSVKGTPPALPVLTRFLASTPAVLARLVTASAPVLARLAVASTPVATSFAAPKPSNNFPAAIPVRPLITPAFSPSFKLPVSMVAPKPEPIAPAAKPPIPPSIPAPPRELPTNPSNKGKNASGCPVSGLMVNCPPGVILRRTSTSVGFM